MVLQMGEGERESGRKTPLEYHWLYNSCLLLETLTWNLEELGNP